MHFTNNGVNYKTWLSTQSRVINSSQSKAISTYLIQYISLLLVILLVLLVAIQHLPKYLSVNLYRMVKKYIKFLLLFHTFWERGRSFPSTVIKAGLKKKIFLKSCSLPYFLLFTFARILLGSQDAKKYLHALAPPSKCLTSSKWPFTGLSTELKTTNEAPLTSNTLGF